MKNAMAILTLSLIALACATRSSSCCRLDEITEAIQRVGVAQSWRDLTPQTFVRRWRGPLKRSASETTVTLQTPSSGSAQCLCCVSAMFLSRGSSKTHLQQLRIDLAAHDAATLRTLATSLMRLLSADVEAAETVLDEPLDARIDRAFVLGPIPPKTGDSDTRTVDIVIEQSRGLWHATIVANDVEAGGM